MNTFLKKVSEFKWYAVFPWLYAIFSGIIFALPFISDRASFLWPAALVPYLLLSHIPLQRRRKTFFLGWLAGATAFGAYLSWFFAAVPLSWLGIESIPIGYLLTFFGWLLPVAYFGLFFGIFSVIIRGFSKNIAMEFIVIVSLWPIFEWGRTWGYSFYPFAQGAGHIFGDHVGFMLLGYTLAPYAGLRQFAQFLGTYGLGLLVIIPNALLFSILRYELDTRGKGLLFWKIGAGIFIVLIFYGLGFFPWRFLADLPKKNIRVDIIQTNLTPENWKDASYQRSVTKFLVAKALKSSSDIIVMPEGASSLFDSSSAITYPSKEDAVKILGVWPYRLVIDTTLGDKNYQYNKKNTTALIDNELGMRGIYEKQFLMPWGEYMPDFFILVAKLFGADSWLNAELSSLSYIPGGKTQVFETPIGVLGILTCSEILSPKLWREIAAQNPSLVIFSASDGILRGSYLLSRQIISMAQIRAAEARIPIVYATNGGRSFVIDENGGIIFVAEEAVNGNYVIDIGTDNAKTKTFANRFPYAAVFFGFLIVVGVLCKKYSTKFFL